MTDKARSEEAEELLRKLDKWEGKMELEKPDPINPPPRLNNRDLQQAILDTFKLWGEASEGPAKETLSKHFNTLLNLQLIRARGGVVE